MFNSIKGSSIASSTGIGSWRFHLYRPKTVQSFLRVLNLKGLNFSPSLLGGTTKMGSRTSSPRPLRLTLRVTSVSAAAHWYAAASSRSDEISTPIVLALSFANCSVENLHLSEWRPNSTTSSIWNFARVAPSPQLDASIGWTVERWPKGQVTRKVVWLYVRADLTHAYAFHTLAYA